MAFLVYLLTACAYLGLPPLLEGGSQYIGGDYNPQIFIWSFAWWPHAILHGQNPFVTHAVWAPVGASTSTWVDDRARPRARCSRR